MTGKKKNNSFKIVGACGAALMLFTAVAPASSVLFNDAVTAEAATNMQSQLVSSADFAFGTFTDKDQALLNNSGVNYAQQTLADYPVLQALFPTAPTSTKLVVALGYQDSTDTSVKVMSNVPAGTTLFQLNQMTTPITVTFQVANGSDVVTPNQTSTLKIVTNTVNAPALNKTIGSSYEKGEGITVTSPTAYESKLTYDKAATEANVTAGKFAVEDVTPASYGTIDTYLNTAKTTFTKTVTNFKQTLKVTYVTIEGGKNVQYVDRMITVAPQAENMASLALMDSTGAAVTDIDGNDIYVNSGSTVSSVYSYNQAALAQAPKEGTAAWIKSNIFENTNQIKINNTLNTGKYFNIFPGNNADTLKSSDIKVDAGNVNLQVAGDYFYTVTVTNSFGLTSTFKMPLKVTANMSLPTMTYAVGYNETMTIKAGTSFDPYEGVTFYENGTQTTANEIPSSRVTVSGVVNTSTPGTYTLTYNVVNTLGETATFNRTINVVSEINGVAVYRAYNPNSGEHLYTKSEKELKEVVAAGWIDEGKAFVAAEAGAPVYRLYNPNTGEHFYTTSMLERDDTVRAGWTYEGEAFYSATEATGIPVYRAFNPNAKGAGSHLFTQSEKEISDVVKAGWKNEGVAFYALKD